MQSTLHETAKRGILRGSGVHLKDEGKMAQTPEIGDVLEPLPTTPRGTVRRTVDQLTLQTTPSGRQEQKYADGAIEKLRGMSFSYKCMQLYTCRKFMDKRPAALAIED